MDFPMMKKPLHFYKDSSEAPKSLQDAAQKIREADAYVMVTGEYNHSIPPGLSNMLNYFPGSIYSYKPCGIVCYSPGELQKALEIILSHFVEKFEYSFKPLIGLFLLWVDRQAWA